MCEIDFLIIGSGAAGLTAAIYAARSGISVLVLDSSSQGGQAFQIDELENYPGVFPSIKGSAFIDNMKKQALNFGAVIQEGEAKSIKKEGDFFYVSTVSDDEEAGTQTQFQYKAKALLYAAGSVPRHLGIPGEKRFLGKGVSYCAVCDGPFFKNKKVVVVGGGDSALSEAVYLSRIAKQVELIHRRSSFRAQKAVSMKILKADNINVTLNTVVEEISGSKGGKYKNVSEVKVKNVITGVESVIETDAVFIFIGMEPKTSILDELKDYGLSFSEGGYIKTDESMQTGVEGFFCAGDVREKPFRQVVTACSDGAIAAHTAGIYLEDLKAKIKNKGEK